MPSNRQFTTIDRKLILQALAIVAAGLWIYWPTLHGDWLWDDDSNITANGLLHDSTGLWKIWFNPGSLPEYYPITQTIQWGQWQSWHHDVLGYHVTNIGLHLLSALLVWHLFSKFNLRFAWMGGLIFAIHPLAIESAAWISELKNTLSLPPFLLSMCFYIDYEKNKKERDYWLAVGFFLAAMLCKVSMAFFPLVILLYQWWLRGGLSWSDLKSSAPFFFISFTLLALALWAQTHYAEIHHAQTATDLTESFSHRWQTWDW